MKKIVVTVSITFLYIGGASWACDYPERVDVPNGKTASQEEMVAGQRAVKDYMTAMQGYLDCLDTETDMESDETSDEQKAILISKHNAAVDEMEAVAQAFNEEVRDYKAANQ